MKKLKFKETKVRISFFKVGNCWKMSDLKENNTKMFPIEQICALSVANTPNYVH